MPKTIETGKRYWMIQIKDAVENSNRWHASEIADSQFHVICKFDNVCAYDGPFDKLLEKGEARMIPVYKEAEK